jgi:hypothetical protein
MRSARMAEIGEIGAGVGLFPNNMRILQQPSVVDSVTRRAAPINSPCRAHQLAVPRPSMSGGCWRRAGLSE